MLLRIAWRNLWRHRARTLTLASAIAFSYALLLISMGVGDDGHAEMLEAAARAAGGDILVHGAGYWESRATDIAIDDADAVLATIERVPGVRAAIPRVLIQGLVSTAAGNRPVQLAGIVPARERALEDIADDVEGSFLDDPAYDDPIVLGSDIVDELELELGDRVVLTATDIDGEVTRALFHLTGILRTGMAEADELLGYTTLEAAREAVRMEGRLTQIGLRVDEDLPGDTIVARITKALGPRAGDLEILTWQEAVPEMVGFVQIDDAFAYIFLAAIFGVVAFAIANTFLMAVMERVREFGLLSALGLKGRRIGALLLLETTLMAGLAMAAGFLFGFAGHLAIDHWGISMAIYGMEEVELSGIDISDLVMHSRITPVKWIVGSLLVALVTIASALYPAWRAGRLAPAQAMRFFE